MYDSDKFPFYVGEPYHQYHCNFFMSEGMPYPDSYVLQLWEAQKRSGRIQPNGCPGGPHSSCAARSFW